MLSLIIPTYNEVRNITRLVERVVPILQRAVDSFEVIVVDDDSPDGTWEIAQKLAVAEPRLKVIRRLEERGLATAVVAGWKAASGDVLGVMDGDCQHDPEILEKMVRTMETTTADIVIGSRHVADGGVSDWSVIRRTISWGATCLATLAIPGILRNVLDPMSGYFILRRSVVESVRLQPTGYKILLEVLAKGRYRDVREVPYIFEERKEGASKLGPRQYGEYLLHLARLARQTGELDRLLRFCAVGTSGMVVNQAALWFFTEGVGLYYLHASLVAVELAILSNYFLNEFWTFRDKVRHLAGVSSRFQRFLKFNLICAGGAILNTTVLWALTSQFGVNYLYSNLAGIALATVWNYWINANVTWGVLVPREVEDTDVMAPEAIDLGERRPIKERRREF